MHVLMLSDMETQGGAAIAASRLAEALCKAGHRVTRIVNVSDGRTHPWKTTQLAFSLYGRAVRRLLPRLVWDALAGHVSELALRRNLRTLNPEVINVHNLHAAVWTGGWSPRLASICADYAPTVWTLHDMWSFTGRCTYSYDCRKFLTGCNSACPTPEEYPALAPWRISGAWKRRKRILRAYPRLVAVTPSRWLAEEAKAGLWGDHIVEVIPNGLRVDVYQPLDRGLARQALGIDAQGPILMLVANVLTERRKGVHFLLNALQHMSQRPLTLITLGDGQLRIETDGVSPHRLGYIDHERTKVLAYNAADLLVHPATVDNLPNVIMEAIACGTPVVGFRVGGVPEMVRPRVTGWLADEVSAEGLARALDTAIDDTIHGMDLRQSSRAVAETEYGCDMQGQRYAALFSRVVGEIT